MVKLIVLDVDGVIVGHKLGVNFPYPNQKVISELKRIRKQGIPIVLCSGKYRRAIEPIALEANLNNPHITDGGGLVTNPVSKKIIHAFNIEKSIASDIINICIQNKIYIEAFSAENYFIQKDYFSETTSRRGLIMQKEPIAVASLADESKKHGIIRLLPIAFNRDDKEKIESLLEPYKSKVSLVWSMHPSTKPWEYYLITAANASKGNAVEEVAKDLGISLNDALGVGDTLGDWEFMKLCGYTAAMGDAPEELKKLANFTAPSVDEDGILKVFEYFL